MDSGGFPRPGDAVHRFDVALQRAVAAGLAVALVQGVTAATLGRALYPSWWMFGAGPVTAAGLAVVIVVCARGRLTRPGQIAFSSWVCAAALLAAVAAGPAVPDVGTAVLPVVVVCVLGLGFLASPPYAVGLGGAVVVADTVVPGLLRPEALPDFVTQAAVQSLVLVATTVGGWAARRVASTEERALDELAAAVAADRAAAAARAEQRELEREVHDTVLNTFAALARGGLLDSAAVRGRCRDDAEFIRTRRAPDDRVLPALDARLDAAAAAVREPGFDVVLTLPEGSWPEPPREVVTALARATREALNNVRRHSGAPGARVVVRRESGGVTVEVLDDGCGATLEPAALGLGVPRSIVERLDDVGGYATIRSEVGRGTTVMMRWPR